MSRNRLRQWPARIGAVAVATSLAASGCAAEHTREPDATATPGMLTAEPAQFQGDRALSSSARQSLRIQYRSTSGIDGSATTVSGVVFVPKGEAPQTGWPIASIGHPTSGIGSDCAPSANADLLGTSDTVASFLDRGFVVVMTDYQGLGTPGPHPFLEPKTAAYNVIDAVRAARQAVPHTSDSWIGYGFSQGGHAVWAANEMASEYGRGLNLLGSVSLAPPADLRPVVDAMLSKSLTVEQIILLPLLLRGLQTVHPDLDLNDYLHGVMADNLDVFLTCSDVNAGLKQSLAESASPEDVMPSSPEATLRLRHWLGDFSLPSRRASAPMLLGFGDADPVVSPEWTYRAVQQACSLNDILDVHVEAGQGHAVDIGGVAADWIRGRQQNAPAPDSCPAA